MKKTILTAMALLVASCLGLTQFGFGSAFAAPVAASQATSTATKSNPKFRTSQLFIGNVRKEKSGYELTAGSIHFKLANSRKVKKYVGEQVKITGKLNVVTNTIHVQKIQKYKAAA